MGSAARPHVQHRAKVKRKLPSSRSAFLDFMMGFCSSMRTSFEAINAVKPSGMQRKTAKSDSREKAQEDKSESERNPKAEFRKERSQGNRIKKLEPSN